MLTYTITTKNSGAHLLDVSVVITTHSDTITAKLPKWIPGSYKIRDYSRFIQSFKAVGHHDLPLSWEKTDSDTWVVDTRGVSQLEINYEVYAYDLSVRGAYFDDSRLFFNHCCVAVDIVEYNEQPRSIIIETQNDWPLFTALPLIEGTKNHFTADDYNHQIDCPLESAEKYSHSEFVLENVTHEVIFTGSIDEQDDIATMTEHLKNICSVEMRLFGGTPLDKYLFMTYIEPKQYGGLEHKDSVAQVASPEMLMKKGKPITSQMIDFMGLCSHEYFHLWNVKRLQPRDFQPYDLYREQNTEMLWFFEGFTSYYEELFLLRAGIVDASTFLQRQAKNLTRVLSVPGRLIQPLASSSFDAWTKLYQADANSANNMVSYYSKGAVFTLYIDLFIRKQSKGKASTDDVIRNLWKNFGEKGIGIVEDDVFVACSQCVPQTAHAELAELFIQGLHGTNDFDFDDILDDFAITVTHDAPITNNQEHISDSGIKVNTQQTIAFLAATSNAAKEGVSVHDTIIAINNQTSQQVDFNQLLNFSNPHEVLMLTLSRRGRVFEKKIQLAVPEKNRVSFYLASENALNKDWLACWI